MSRDTAATQPGRGSAVDADHAAENHASVPTLDRLPVGVYRTSPGGRMLYANQAVADLLGYPDPGSLIGVPVAEHYVEPEAPGRWMAEVKETATVHRRELQVRKGDGTTAWVGHTARIVRDDEGEILWFEGVMEDARELHRLREERERSASRLSLLEEVAIAGNATSDAEEIFRLVLERVCNHTGWPVGHVYLVSDENPSVLWPANLWHLDDPERFRRLVDVTTVSSLRRGVSLPGRVLATGEAVWIPDLTTDEGCVRARQEPELGVRGGFAFPVLVGEEVAAVFEFFSPRISEPDEEFLELTVRVGAVVGRVVERARSAREIRRLHDELEERVERRTAELAASVQEMEAFTYSVSHDLRAPLRALDGFSQALLEDYGEEVNETGKDYLERVRRASQRMGDLIDDLLRLSRISRRSLESRTVDLSELCREVMGKLAERDPERSVEVEIEEGLQTWGDPALLRIVLANLLSNAWKFTGNEVEARIEVEGRVDDGELVVHIRDNGAGFDPEYADRLFSPFQRLHRDDEFPGTGIGLATAKRILDRHGGRIRADGEPGVGATFSFVLPRREREPGDSRHSERPVWSEWDTARSGREPGRNGA